MNPKIYIAGHRGMVGSAIIRQLISSPSPASGGGARAARDLDAVVGHPSRLAGSPIREGALPPQIITKTHAELDLTNQAAVRAFFEAEKPDQVYLAAAKVGGIHANNTYPAEFIYQNLMIEANIVHEAFKVGVKKLLFLGSSCIYPKLAPQPMREDALLTGTLEPTNEPYAIAKIAGIKLCESYNRQYGASHGTDYRSVMPTNLYGPGDNYHPENSHVIPALIRRFHEAKVNNAESVVIWGTGTPMREFLYVDDMAAASVHVMNLDKATYDANTQPMLSHINVGTGEDITIRQLAETMAKVIGYPGRIEFDPTKPDGAPRKLMDVSRLRDLGWQAKVELEQGLALAYADFQKR
jgi:GDP-L-fucose synthase